MDNIIYLNEYRKDAISFDREMLIEVFNEIKLLRRDIACIAAAGLDIHTLSMLEKLDHILLSLDDFLYF